MHPSEIDEEISVDNLVLFHKCNYFIMYEAELLDSNNLFKWLELLTEDIDYRVPVRTTRERSANSFSNDSYHFKDDYSSLETRIERVATDYDWSENPPSRTRRFVAGIRIVDTEDDEVKVNSNLLLYRNRQEKRQPDIISAARTDTLRRVNGGLKLSSRTVFLDHTFLQTDRLSIFL